MTFKVSVDYDAGAESLVIDGDVAGLYRDPSIATFLRATGVRKKTDTRLEIEVPRAALQSKFRALQKLLHRSGIEETDSHSVSELMGQVRRNEELFAEFAARAQEIWDARLETEELRQFAKILSRECPGRTLYRLQLLSSYHLAFSQNACNFSVPGAGKTSVVYGAYAYLHSLSRDDPKYVDSLLVVGPLSSFKAWEDEYREIFLKNPASRRIAGFVPQGERQALLRGYDPTSGEIELALTTYQSLANNIEDFRVYLASRDRRVMMVLDEAHNIKRDDGVWASAALDLAEYAASRVVLTGTPAPNGYEDLANLYKFIYPDRDVIGFSGGALKMMSQGRMTPAAMSTLKQKIRPFYTRIKKSDLNLPGIKEEVRTYEMDSFQAEIYKYIEHAVVRGLGARTNSPDEFLARARLMRLRQAACNPGLLLRPLEEALIEDPHGGDYEALSDSYIHSLVRNCEEQGSLRRIQMLKNLFEYDLESEARVLVWTYFLGNIPLIESAAKEFFDETFVISGATPASDDYVYEMDDEADVLRSREAIIDAFHGRGGRKLLIANPQAIGESISLHKACHAAVYFDRDFNAGRFIQSKDRIHRYGLDPAQSTLYVYLVAKDTVDEVIGDRLEFKEERLRELIDSEEIPLFSLGESGEVDQGDIKAIIEAYERKRILS